MLSRNTLSLSGLKQHNSQKKLVIRPVSMFSISHFNFKEGCDQLSHNLHGYRQLGWPFWWIYKH